MTDESINVEQTEQTSLFIGPRLKKAREALGLSVKDVSYQLRLNENVIQLIESDQLPGDLPITFARGYLRTYGKFLNLHNDEINNAISKLFPNVEYAYTTANTPKKPQTFISNQRVMQLSTSLITVTLVGLVVTWWFNHSANTDNTPVIAENITKELTPLPTKIELSQSISAPESLAVTPVITAMKNNMVAINTPAKKEVSPTPVTEASKPDTQQPTANNNKTETQSIHLAENQKTSPLQNEHHDDEDEDENYEEYDDVDME